MRKTPRRSSPGPPLEVWSSLRSEWFICLCSANTCHEAILCRIVAVILYAQQKQCLNQKELSLISKQQTNNTFRLALIAELVPTCLTASSFIRVQGAPAQPIFAARYLANLVLYDRQVKIQISNIYKWRSQQPSATRARHRTYGAICQFFTYILAIHAPHRRWSTNSFLQWVPNMTVICTHP